MVSPQHLTVYRRALIFHVLQLRATAEKRVHENVRFCAVGH